MVLQRKISSSRRKVIILFSFVCLNCFVNVSKTLSFLFRETIYIFRDKMKIFVFFTTCLHNQCWRSNHSKDTNALKLHAIIIHYKTHSHISTTISIFVTYIFLLTSYSGRRLIGSLWARSWLIPFTKW
jgi:hypothetical protein